MRRTLSTLAFALTFISVSAAADIQGVIADWNCVQKMVRNGREKTLQHDRGCSLVKNSNRPAYGVITDDKKYYRLDGPGNQQAKQLLGASPNKDNLRVIVRGDLDGDTIKVNNMSIL